MQITPKAESNFSYIVVGILKVGMLQLFFISKRRQCGFYYKVCLPLEVRVPMNPLLGNSLTLLVGCKFIHLKEK